MKKIAKILLCVITLCGFPITAFGYDFMYDDMFFKWNANKTEVFLDKGSYLDDVVIPSEVEYKGKKYPVTGIVENAFDGSNITSLTIPASIKRVGFRLGIEGTCPVINIETLDSWCALDGYWGRDLSKTKLMLNGKLVTDLSSLTPECKTIGQGAFYNYKYLKSIVIPDWVKKIDYGQYGNRSFYGCDNVRTIVIGSGVDTVRSTMFANNIDYYKTLVIKDSENPLVYESHNSTRYNGFGTIYLGRRIKIDGDGEIDAFVKGPIIVNNRDGSDIFYRYRYSGSILDTKIYGPNYKGKIDSSVDSLFILLDSASVITSSKTKIYALNKNKITGVGNIPVYDLLQNSLLDKTTYEYGDRPNLSDTAFVSNLKILKMRVVDNDKNVGSYDGVEVHFGLDSLFDMKVRYPYSY